MKTNYEAAHAWAHGKNAKGLNIHSLNGILYSYSTPIGIRVGEAFIIDNSFYSMSTRKHQSYAFGAAYGNRTFSFDFPCFESLLTWRIYPNYLMEIIIKNFEHFLSIKIDNLERSFSLTDEDEVDISEWHEIERLCSLICDRPIKQIIPAYCTISDYLASHDVTKKSQVISFALGNRYEEYVGRTMSARKARRTRGLEVEIPEISEAAKARAQKSLRAHLEEIREKNAEKRERERQRKEERERRERDRQLRIRYTEEELKEKWYTGEFNGHFFSQDSDFFGGGNVLLRIKSGRIETTKGIFLTLDEGRRLWKIIKELHGCENESLNIEVRTLCGRFTITSYKNDILTAGCHCIAFSEMEKVANLLFEEQEQEQKELIAVI